MDKLPRNILKDRDFMNEINLKEIFSEEEMQNFIEESEGQTETCGFGQIDLSKSPSFLRSNKVNSFLFDRSKFILKLIKISKNKLASYNENFLVKGLEWLSNEIQDSLYFKSDEGSIQKLEELKKENQDMKYIFSWLEEYSTIKIKFSDGIARSKLRTIKCKDINSIPLTVVKNYLGHGESPSDDEGIDFLDSQREMENFINFSEDCIATIEEPTFDIFKFEDEVGAENTLSVVGCYIFTTNGHYSLIKYDKFENFIQAIAKGYRRENPYHNDLHAADVSQTCMIYLKHGKIKDKIRIDDFDQCSLLISCMIHDFKHPGVNNGFLVATSSPIAVKYNDSSVLENFHVAESFKLIKSSDNYNIFSHFSNDEYKLMRKRIVQCVLATDMIFHAKQFSFLKVKIEKYGISRGINVDKIFEGVDPGIGTFSLQQEFFDAIIHMCDISNPTKPFYIYTVWVDKVMEEFWRQGDKEKELKLPVSFLCDRATVTKPSAQLGFMDGIVGPYVSAFVEIFPELSFLLENVNTNKQKYRKIKEEDEKLKQSK